MVTEAVNWLFDSTGLIFTLITTQWLLSAFLFVSILGMIVNLINQVKNKK